MEGKVQTVLGPIDPDQLGITLSHEHLLVDGSFTFNQPLGASARKLAHEQVTADKHSLLWHDSHVSLDNLSLLDENMVVEELMEFKKEGGATVVEVTNIGLSRDPLGLARISRMTGLNVVMGSGYYTAESQNSNYDSKSEKEIAEEIIGDIRVGVGSTGIRAGIIGEIGCSTWPLDKRETKSLHAAALAQKQTGAAISIHIGSKHDIPKLEIVKMLEDAGVDNDRIIMSHVDLVVSSLDMQLELAQTGCYLEYDGFGTPAFNPARFGARPRPCDRERLEQIVGLIDHGHLEQILLSQDVWQKARLLRFGGNGYAHILRNMVPQLLIRGITREQMHTMLVENPKRVLPFKRKE